MKTEGRISFCNGWEFTEVWSDAFLAGQESGLAVDLPHNVGELPLHYAEPAMYSRICGYRKTLTVSEEDLAGRVFLQFDGAAHIATVYVNGTECAVHYGGYTAFRVEAGPHLHAGENTVAVKLDTTENPCLPPFGFVIDYLTYGGLYREVWLEKRSRDYIDDIFVMTPKFGKVRCETAVCGSFDAVRYTVADMDGSILAETEVSAEEAGLPAAAEAYAEDGTETCDVVRSFDAEFEVPSVSLWSPEHPVLYRICASLIRNGEACDTVSDIFGFRHFQWKKDGLYINGERFFFRGLNRHQSYPYMGYAAPASLQAEDARILKEELCCSAVRTSHYPQSQHFVDACDALGLLVFTEIPGWQHIGDEAWQDKAVDMVREMVLQYRNHPSIFLWGVRINESQDNDDFYTRTNAVARVLDPTRKTSGVRYIENSSLLEDVYAFNDFSHNGKTPGCKPKSRVTKHKNKPFFISECNGHMFPTKPFDTWEKRQEHALRHARVMDAAEADGDHAGIFEWCMFDYQTHKDFGSGDRICYHGVLDVFRNPKLAASVWASQGEKPYLAVSSPMDIGDYPASDLGDVYAFTNADVVRLYKNDDFVAEFFETDFTAMPHGPVRIDDFVGDLLESEEGFDHEKAEAIRAALTIVKKYGSFAMPLADKMKVLRLMAKYEVGMEEGTRLFGKYVSSWGVRSTVWRFEAVKDGEVVAAVTMAPSVKLHLEVRVSAKALPDGRYELKTQDTWDAAAIRVRVLDENGNIAPYAQLPVRFTLTGEAERLGPETVTAEGGMCGTYVRTVPGKSGEAQLIVSAEGLAPVTVTFAVS